MQNLATIQKILYIKSIEGADVIELVSINEKQCIAKKGEFKTGDHCVYFEAGSFLPIEERYEFLRRNTYRDNKFMGTGFLIKTINMRGETSQGLALPIRMFPEVVGRAIGEDVTELLNVRKYELPFGAMDEYETKTISKYMSLVLRHRPKAAYITLDKNGWADVSSLIEGLNRSRRVSLTFEDIKYVVENNDKKRYSFNDDLTKIRANQGHSVKVDVELKESQPPTILYHGTAGRYIGSIIRDGLKAKKRLHVHLSSDKNTAIKVGRRHGKPVILIIDSVKMYTEGYKFYLSENGVWLTEHVPAKYLMFNDVISEYCEM